MAASALDILSLAELKAELRIAAEESEHDSLLIGHIGAAVAFVGRFLRAPLVDSIERHRCTTPGTDRPLAIRADHVQSLSAIRYWPDGTALREEPSTIAVADLGRREQVGKWYCIYPPADGWPEAETGSMLEVDLTRSILLTPRTVALRQAVILCARALYDAEPMIKPTASMYALIFPWRRLDADPPGTLVTVLDEEPSATGPFYLLASEDETFSQLEVVASGVQRAVAIPPNTIPPGGTRYIAYALPATEPEPDYVYYYLAGARDEQNHINAFEHADNLDIAGVRHRIIRTRGAWRDTANGRVIEAGSLADVPDTPVVPPAEGNRYLLSSADDSFSVSEVILTVADGSTTLDLPSDTIPDGGTAFVAYARLASAGSYTRAYYYPTAFPNTRNVLIAFNEGPELEIDGEMYLLLRSKGAWRDTANNGRVLDAD